MKFNTIKYITKGIKEDNFMSNRHYDYCKKKEVPFVMITINGSLSTIEVNISMWSDLLQIRVKEHLKDFLSSINKKDLPNFNNNKISNFKVDEILGLSGKSLYCLSGNYSNGEFVAIAEWLYDIYFEIVKKVKSSSEEH